MRLLLFALSFTKGIGALWRDFSQFALPLSLGEGAGGEVSHARAHSECCGNGCKNGDGCLKDDLPSVVFHDDIFLKLIMKPHPPTPLQGEGSYGRGPGRDSSQLVFPNLFPSPWERGQGIGIGIGGRSNCVNLLAFLKQHPSARTPSPWERGWGRGVIRYP